MYHGKELLSSFRLSGHTIRFHPQTRVKTTGTACNKQYHRKVLYSSFYLTGQIGQLHPQTQILEPPSYSIINSTIGT